MDEKRKLKDRTYRICTVKIFQTRKVFKDSLGEKYKHKIFTAEIDDGHTNISFSEVRPVSLWTRIMQETHVYD